MTSRTTSPINLMRGWPNPSLLPTHLIKAAANAALSDPTVAADALLYGPDPGYEPCRQSIAKWLNDFYRPRQSIAASRICITGGASQNLGCILDVYTDPEYTRNIWIVAPAYMLAFRIFEDAGFSGKMRAVPEDEEGINIDYLVEQMKKSEEQAKKNKAERPRFKPERQRAKVYKQVIYCVPSFANPSSRTMSRSRRQALVQAARDFDALIVADDVYDFLQWPAKTEGVAAQELSMAHMPRLVDIDRDLHGGSERPGADAFGNACSNGSFSKIAGPGMRVGWVEGTEKFAYGVSQTGTTASGGAPSQLASTFVTTLLSTGQLDDHIKRVLRPAYAARYATLVKAISTYLLPLGFSVPQPDRNTVGGYFAWLAIPEPLTADALTQRCLQDEEVIIAPGTIFEVPGDAEAVGFEGHIRLCWAWEEVWKLEEGVMRIAKVTGEMLREQKEGILNGVGTGGGYVVVDKPDVDSFK